MTDCRYFDGSSSRPHAASADVVDDALRVVGEGFERIVGKDALRFALATGRGASQIEFASGGLCEFSDRAAAEDLFDRAGYRRAQTDRLASTPLRATGVTAVFVVLMAALYIWGVPLLADQIVDRAPYSWDQALGPRVLQTLDRQRFFKPTAVPEERRDRIVDRFDGFRSAYQRSRSPKDEILIEFRRMGAPNALALPGDIIVVTDEMVELVGDDDTALMTVLAHEVGHLAHRDAMRQLVRSTTVSVVAAWYLGDVSNAAAAVAGGIGTLSYSRAAEHQADLYAVDTMKANHLSTKSAAALFRRLEQWEPPPDDGATKGRDADRAKSRRVRLSVPEYLSTHPDTDARIALFDADGAVEGRR